MTRYQFTIITPTLNRAHLLPRLYESLVKQTLPSLEWIIADGGSKDGTAELAARWNREGKLPVKFLSEQGAPKHTAVNFAVKAAEGEFVQIMDSDDEYVPAAFERFLHHWRQIPEMQRAGFVGVCGLVSDYQNNIVGRKFPQDVLDSDDFELQTRYRIIGDEKISVLRTDVLRQFPFPEDLGRFVSEELVWNRIGLRYRTRFVNEVFVLKEYQEGGLTSGVQLLGPNNPKAAALVALEFARAGRPIPLDLKVKAYAHYLQYSRHAGESWWKSVKDLPSRVLATLCVPLGVGLYWRALWRQRAAAQRA